MTTPAQVDNTVATGTEARVCADIAKRQQVGIAKYGTTVKDNPLSLREWLQHAYEEMLDSAVYLKRAMEEMEKGGWLPIETAPKDGERILGCYVKHREVFIVRWSTKLHDPQWIADAILFPIPTPTHWMPLPKAPASA